jgi:hypothetical protein
VPLAKMCRSIGGVCFLQCLRNRYFSPCTVSFASIEDSTV